MQVPQAVRRPVVILAGALVLPPALAALLRVFQPVLATVASALLLVVVIVGVAASGNRPAGWLASLSAAASFDFFLTAPYFRFAIFERTDIEVTVLLLFVGVAVTEIATRARRHRAVAAIDERQLDGIAEVTALVASGADPKAVVRLVSNQLSSIFRGAPCTFDRSSFGGRPRLHGNGRLTFDGDQLDTTQFGLPATDIEILAECQGRPYGRFVLSPSAGAMVPTSVVRTISILAGQVGAALASEMHGSERPPGHV